MAQAFLHILRERLGPDLLESQEGPDLPTAVVTRPAWEAAVRLAKDEAGFAMLSDLCAVDYPGQPERFEVVAHLADIAKARRLRLKVRCPEADPVVPTITGVTRAADWFEREAYDLFGVRFEGHPNLKRLLCHQQFEGHALRKDFPKERRGAIPVPDTLMDEMTRSSSANHESRITNHDEMSYLNIGPSHPAMHGCFRVLVALDGERIVRAVPEIGYLHRCFEKEAETHPWPQVIPYADRLNYVSPMMNTTGLCRAVEELWGIEVPERAIWIRMLVCEVSRIWDHLVAVGANLVDIGAYSPFWYLFHAREAFTDWIEALTGARLTSNYTRIGGVSRDLPSGTEKKLAACIAGMRQALRDTRAIIQKNRVFLDRTQGVGAISEEEAIERGFTGPCLRATGCSFDVRRAHPYYFYGDLDWEIPVGICGDTFDRIFVRLEEMEQSGRIVEQILARLPQGPIITPRRDVALPPLHEVYGSIEGMMSHFNLIMHGVHPPAGEIYSFTEAANGELGFYVVSDGSDRPYRIKVRPPCFPIYQAFPRLIEGGLIADAVATMGSLNIIAGELDR